MLTLMTALALAGGPLTDDELHALASQTPPQALPMSGNAGEVSLDLPEALRPLVTRVHGKVVWRYLGQMTFSDEPGPPPTSTRTFDSESAAHIVRLQAFDAFGRHWETDSWWPAIDAATEAEPLSGTVEWYAHQWTGEDCDVENRRDDHFWWNGNSQVHSADDGMDAWESNSVLIDNRQARATCSGALVSATGWGEPAWVLTAAHCLEAGSLGHFALPGDIHVVTPNPRQQYRVAATILPASYSSWPGTDFRSDLALLLLVPNGQPDKLVEASPGWSLDEGSPRYRLATDGVVEPGEPGRMVSWPTFLQGCEVAEWAPYSNVDDEFGKQRRRHVQLYMDGGPGQSGSPVGRCPHGCTMRAPGDITAVYAGWNSLSKAHVGPWVPFYAQAFNGVMQ